MSMQGSDKDKGAKGRHFDQLTRSGTSSAGSVGPGGTGDAQQAGRPGGMQQAGRTDDLLSGGCDADQDNEGFREGSASRGGGTGRQGAGSSGNLQSGEPNQQGIRGQRTTETDRDEDESRRER
ncbi:hypothetical protein [Massilia niastensis]|uniref:hypothetical protein n=1 Tax=Massilia niastensis TaxID=544911 RepID=UPI0003758541|nr:hypothetical protein [Massilia niastensis]